MKKIAKILGLSDEATEDQIVEALESRGDLSKVRTALGIAEDADTDAVVKAIEDASEEKTLEDRAREENKVLLDATQVQELTEKAERGDKAAKQLHQNAFDAAYDSALDELRVDAKDETKERFQKLYDLAPAETLATLADLPKIASDKPRGSGKPAAGEVPDGVDEERYELHQEVLAYMDEHDESDYVKALNKVQKARA